MDCKEVLELVTPAVDGKLEPAQRTHFDSHLKDCNHCRGEFELEHITKRTLKLHISRAAVPNDSVARITATLSQEALQHEQHRYIFGRPKWRPFIAIAGVAVAILIFVLNPITSQHSHARPTGNDIIDQTYNNFGEVLKGSFVPSVTSDDPSVVKSYFASNADFNVNIPHNQQGKLVGGMLSRYNDECIAHLIYKHKQSVIYVYQTCLRSVLENNKLQLSEYAKNELQRRGWYFEKQCSDCTLMLWAIDSTVCCAVADMDKPQLLAFFNQTE